MGEEQMKALKLRNQNDELNFIIYEGEIIIEIKEDGSFVRSSYSLPERQIPKIIEWLERSSIVCAPLRDERANKS
jgi:hypothetical protein